MSHSVFGAIFFMLQHFSGKHGILDAIPRNLFEAFKNDSKLFHTVPNCQYMKGKIFGNLITLGNPCTHNKLPFVGQKFYKPEFDLFMAIILPVKEIPDTSD